MREAGEDTNVVVRTDRHEADTEELVDAFDERSSVLPKALAAVHQKGNAAAGVFKFAIEYAEWGSVGDPNAQTLELWDMVTLAAQAGSAVFTLASADPGTDIEFRLKEETYRHVAEGRKPDATTRRDWRQVLNVLIITREQNRIEKLCTVPDSVLAPRRSGVEAEYSTHWVNAWKAFWLKDTSAADHVTEAIRLTSEEHIGQFEVDYINHIDVPQLLLFANLLQGNPTAFNQTLTSALEDHKTYYTTGERTDLLAGYIAWGPLALACIAYDHGWPIDVESDYLPKALLHGDWVGEYPL